jgi:hypothetical protein
MRLPFRATAGMLTRLDEIVPNLNWPRRPGSMSRKLPMSLFGKPFLDAIPDFQNAKISGRPATEVIRDEAWL